MKAGRKPMQNLKNTCYINSVIQLLSHVDPFVDQVLDLKDSEIESTEFELVREFKSLLQSIWDDSTSLIVPKQFITSVFNRIKSFPPYTQQDSQEFLTIFLDIIESQVKKIRKNSKIGEIFQGSCIISNKCLQCGKVSENTDFFMQLTLPIPSAEMDNTLDCLLSKTEREVYLNHSFSMFEILKNPFRNNAILNVYYCLKAYFDPQESEMFCNDCETLTGHSSKSQFKHCPDYLFFSFKRFKYSFWAGKVSDQVYLVSELNLKNYGCQADQSQYVLVAVVEHWGFTFKGHYQVYINFYGEWWIFNDKRYKKCSFQKVFKAQPYIALYAQKEKWDAICREKVKHNVDIIGEKIEKIFGRRRGSSGEIPLVDLEESESQGLVVNSRQVNRKSKGDEEIIQKEKNENKGI